MNYIHRAALTGGAVCGFVPATYTVRWDKYPRRHPLRISTTGVGVTCDECLSVSRESSREEMLRSIDEAAARFRAR